MAVGYYSLFESALRHKKNKGFNNHHKYLSNIYENFSHIAVDNKDMPIMLNEKNKKAKKVANPMPEIKVKSILVNNRAKK